MKIFLTGFMGSGKTTIGHMLSDELSLPFFDLDNEIEILEKRSIADIFKTDGEEIFRKLESKVLEIYLDRPGKFILSCGGGTPCFNNNMEKMNIAGITIYLECDIATLHARIIQDNTNRPLINSIGSNDLSLWIKNKLAERVGFYSKAQITIKSDQQIEDTVKNIVQELNQEGTESSR